MTKNTNGSDGSFAGSLGSILRVLLRLLFVLVVGVLIGAGLFYGVPWIYRQLVWPVQENSARIALLEDQADKNSEGIFDNQRALEQQIASLESEVDQLEERVAVQSETQEALEEERQHLAERVATLEQDLEAQEVEIEQNRSAFEAATSGLEGQIEEIQEELEVAQRDLTDQREAAEEAVGDLQSRLDDAVGRVVLLQAAQSLLKVRLLLEEENTGAARDVLELAMAHLDRASALMPYQAPLLGELGDQMMALDDLIASDSFRAGPTLESLWADLMDLVPIKARSASEVEEAGSPLPTPTLSP